MEVKLGLFLLAFALAAGTGRGLKRCLVPTDGQFELKFCEYHEWIASHEVSNPHAELINFVYALKVILNLRVSAAQK